jgi:hypothetical protein
VPAQASGEFRRTPLERSDQQVAWHRTDQAFFASGACHILAWACRDAYPDESIGLAAMRFEGEPRAFHVYATWEGWAFDHSGWNPESDLLSANEAFDRRSVESFPIDLSLADFCDRHWSRMRHQYWRDPVPRARDYVERFPPPWARLTRR